VALGDVEEDDVLLHRKVDQSQAAPAEESLQRNIEVEGESRKGL